MEASIVQKRKKAVSKHWFFYFNIDNVYINSRMNEKRSMNYCHYTGYKRKGKPVYFENMSHFITDFKRKQHSNDKAC